MAMSLSCIITSLYSSPNRCGGLRTSSLKVNCRHHTPIESIQNVVERIGIPSISSSPHEPLQRGNWVKLICGASFEDVVDIRNLSLVYTLAGVDCIDCAADGSVVNAVNEGIRAAREIIPVRRPWVMISVNDHEDLHFRKAEFDPEDCPSDCSRPCERVCPANAISLDMRILKDVQTQNASIPYSKFKGGVITERCYGCGRCFPVCPYDKIRAVTYVRDATATSQLLKRNDVDAIEIHTSGRQIDSFEKLWNSLGDSIKHVKLVAVSLPNIGDSTLTSMKKMYSVMARHLCCCNLWQLDGRPMSGDIGRGTTREAIAFAVSLASVRNRPHGFLQLAGGTNAHTIDGLRKAGLFQTTSINENLVEAAAESRRCIPALISGVAFGGYARKIVGRVLSAMQSFHGPAHIEDYPDYLLNALREALVGVDTNRANLEDYIVLGGCVDILYHNTNCFSILCSPDLVPVPVREYVFLYEPIIHKSPRSQITLANCFSQLPHTRCNDGSYFHPFGRANRPRLLIVCRRNEIVVASLLR